MTAPPGTLHERKLKGSEPGSNIICRCLNYGRECVEFVFSGTRSFFCDGKFDFFFEENYSYLTCLK